jgi:hypothetical protein
VNEVDNPEETLGLLKEYAQYVAEGSIAFLMTKYMWMAGYVVFMCGVIVGFYCYIGKVELGFYTTFVFDCGRRNIHHLWLRWHVRGCQVQHPHNIQGLDVRQLH